MINLDHIKATFLIPTHDNDGTKIVAPITILEADLLNVFGGFTCLPAGGHWKDEHGKKYEDTLLCYYVCMEQYRLPLLRDLLTDFKMRTQQHSVWLDITVVQLEQV